MKTLTAYINFTGNCRQAMQFYKQSLGTELELNPYPDAAGQPSQDPAAKIMHAQLVRNGAAILMASDVPQPDMLKAGNNFSMSLDCSSVEEQDRFFSALGQNGQVMQPLIDAPWGARFGMLTDQFGVQWLFNCYTGPKA